MYKNQYKFVKKSMFYFVMPTFTAFCPEMFNISAKNYFEKRVKIANF